MVHGLMALIYGILILLVILEIKCSPRLDLQGPYPILWYTIKDRFGNKKRDYIEFKYD